MDSPPLEVRESVAYSPGRSEVDHAKAAWKRALTTRWDVLKAFAKGGNRTPTFVPFSTSSSDGTADVPATQISGEYSSPNVPLDIDETAIISISPERLEGRLPPDVLESFPSRALFGKISGAMLTDVHPDAFHGVLDASILRGEIAIAHDVRDIDIASVDAAKLRLDTTPSWYAENFPGRVPSRGIPDRSMASRRAISLDAVPGVLPIRCLEDDSILDAHVVDVDGCSVTGTVDGHRIQSVPDRCLTNVDAKRITGAIALESVESKSVDVEQGCVDVLAAETSKVVDVDARDTDARSLECTRARTQHAWCQDMHVRQVADVSGTLACDFCDDFGTRDVDELISRVEKEVRHLSSFR